MSLLRQLLLSVTLAMIGIVIGVLVFVIGSARQYLGTQLHVQGDAAATSLAVSLSRSPESSQPVRELLFSLMFDSGQFRMIELRDEQGKVLLHHYLEEGASGGGQSPDWFDRWLPVRTTVSERPLYAGWEQKGTIRVLANEAYARELLWSIAERTCLLALCIGLLWGLFVMGIMRWLRRALREDVTRRVEAVETSVRQAAALPPLQHPGLRELRDASQAIEQLHASLQSTAAERNAQIESLELELNQDPVTGLANRKHFVSVLQQQLVATRPGQDGEGHVVLFRQCDLQEINRTLSRQLVDQWLRSLAQLVQGVLSERRGPEAWLARLNGSDFAFLLPQVPGPAAMRTAKAVFEILHAQRIPLSDGHCRWRVVVTDFRPGEALGDVLARLDEALMRAQSAGQDGVDYLPRGELGIASAGRGGSGEHAWRTLLRNALDEDWFTLSVQRIEPIADAETQMRAMLTLEEPGAPSPLSGYVFMPPAVRLGLSAACDERALELALGWLRVYPETLVLRLSLTSILQPTFRAQVAARLAEADRLTRRLVFEFASYGLVAHRDVVLDFGTTLRALGVRLRLRDLDEQPEALMYLHELQPISVQLSARLVNVQEQSPGARRLLVAIRETARELGIQVVGLNASV